MKTSLGEGHKDGGKPFHVQGHQAAAHAEGKWHRRKVPQLCHPWGQQTADKGSSRKSPPRAPPPCGLV